MLRVYRPTAQKVADIDVRYLTAGRAISFVPDEYAFRRSVVA